MPSNRLTGSINRRLQTGWRSDYAWLSRLKIDSRSTWLTDGLIRVGLSTKG